MLASILLLSTLSQAAPAPAKPADDFQPDPAWKPLGKALWFDPRDRKLVLRAEVCLTEGGLEHLLCLERTKEHESVLSTAAAPRQIHAGLILAGALPGHPVRFRPKFEAPAGDPVTLDVEWVEKGKSQHVNAKELVKDEKTGKVLDRDWVFAGSDLFEDPETKRVIYAADGGDLFTVSNFAASILDLPIRSSADDADRGFVANTSKIPPRGTRVTLTLRAAPKPKP